MLPEDYSPLDRSETLSQSGLSLSRYPEQLCHLMTPCAKVLPSYASMVLLPFLTLYADLPIVRRHLGLE